MKKIILIIIAIFCYSQYSLGQEIDMKIGLLGYKFTQSDEKLSWKELLNKTQNSSKSYELIKKAKSQNTFANIVSFSGGVLIGIPIGISLSGDEPNWTLAYIGGGIALLALPISFSALKNVSSGIDVYNESLKSLSKSSFHPEFEIVLNGNGIGLSMTF